MSTQRNALRHLFIIEDGETRANELFTTTGERATRLIELITSHELGDLEGFDDLLNEQNEEALAADYPEGIQPRIPSPADRIDGISEWLAEQGIDVYLDDLDIP